MRDDPELPEAVVMRHSRFRPELIWTIPIVAVLIGGWLAVRAIRARGPIITISFHNAGGLVAGKTKIRYRDVDVGEVRDIGVSPDRTTVLVTAELKREAAAWMVEDTHFWVVRARVAAAEVSGLETLLSGAYIGVDAGTSKRARRHFTGLEEVPVVSAGTKGRMFVARATRAIGAGSPNLLPSPGGRAGHHLGPRGGRAPRLDRHVRARAVRSLRHDERPILGGERDSRLGGYSRRQGRGRVAGDVAARGHRSSPGPTRPMPMPDPRRKGTTSSSTGAEATR